MAMKNTETVAGELRSRLGQRLGSATPDRGITLAMYDYIGDLITDPRGEDFDTEVVRMDRTVRAFLRKESANHHRPQWNEQEAGALLLAGREDL